MYYKFNLKHETLNFCHEGMKDQIEIKKGCPTSYKSQQYGLSKIIGFHDPLPRYDLTGRPDNVGKRDMNNDFSQKYYIVKSIQDKNVA